MSYNCFTVDLEDWYHGIELPFADWAKYPSRIEKGLYSVFELLEKYQSKSTFFTIGWVVEKYPQLVKELSDAGHEIGSHGYSHTKVYDQTKAEFRDEVRRTKHLIEDLTSKEVTTHRSPFFSITSKCLWALDILSEEGYKIDCSISPIKTWRYGINTCPDEIFKIQGTDLIEFPVSKFRFFTKSWAIGGAYFRLFPYKFTKQGMNQRAKKGHYNMFYIHPWEYDADHPKIKFERKAMITHYTNLDKTYDKTEKLLKQFKFETVTSIVKKYEQQHGIKTIGIKVLQD